MKRRVVVLITLCLVLIALSTTAGAEVLQQRQCQGVYQGSVIQGMLQIERWNYYDTHRIYGQFVDSGSTLIEFEVMTNQPGGVGGMWFNHARHREIHIELQLLPTGFIVYSEEFGGVQFDCH
jgi:hypothetical protein